MSSNVKHTVALMRGDGIGPEISDAVVQIFEAAKVPLGWETVECGMPCIEKYGVGITDTGMDALRRNHIALKGPMTTPIGKGYKSINVTIRKALDLFANVRPVLSLPGVESRFSNIDIVIVRENIEDSYGGIEHMQSPDYAQCLRITTRQGSERIARYSFELARREKRKKVMAVHKANIMKMTDGLFLETFREVAKEFPDIESGDIIVDNCCMQMALKPQQFDVLVLPNLFGDIVSDLGAGLIGGLGVAPSANIGRTCAIFEAVHGSAPDIAGKGLANPTALLLSATAMLRHLGMLKESQNIEASLKKVLVRKDLCTRDLGGSGNTKSFTDAIIANLS